MLRVSAGLTWKTKHTAGLGMDEDVRVWAAKVPSQEEEVGQEQGEQNMSSRRGSAAHQCVLLAGAS